jgi:DNA invertase Pin-like site-specific DNA recombinase
MATASTANQDTIAKGDGNKSKVAVYVRVSDEKGRKGANYISPKVQVAEAAGYARSRGYEVGRTFEDRSVSSKVPVDERPGLSALFKSITKGEHVGLVVSTQDRLSGLDPSVFWDVQERCRTLGAALLIRDNPAAENLEAEGLAEIPADVRAVIDKANRKEIGRRWRSAKLASIERGVHPVAHVPVGYLRGEVTNLDDVNAKPGTRPIYGPLQLDPVVAPVIRQVFEMRAGKPKASWRACCELLEAEGILNRNGNTYWAHGAVAAVVENPAYMGWAYLRSAKAEKAAKERGTYTGPIYLAKNENAHAPIVDPALWRGGQADGPGRITRSQEGSLLAGVIFCGSCGHKLAPSVTENRYRCRPGIYADRPCEHPATVRGSEVEPLVTAFFLATCLHHPSATPALDLAPLEQAVVEAKAALQKWIDAAKDGNLDPVAFSEVIPAHKAKVAEAEDRLREARGASGREDERASILEHWGDMSVSEKRRALHDFDVKVIVERGKRPVAERVTLETALAPTAEGWEPDEEWTERLDFGVGRWEVEDGRLIVRHLPPPSPEDEAAAEAIFGKLA